MGNLAAAFSVVFPMFFFMALGYLIVKMHWFEAEYFKKLNGVIFMIFIPTMAFVNIYESDFRKSVDMGLIAGCMIFILLLFGILYAVIPKLVKEKRDASVMIQGIYRSNFVLFGITIAMRIYPGEELGVISTAVAFVVPVFNVLAVVLFETFRGQGVNPGELFIKILKNPLIIGCMLGIFFSITGIQLPGILNSALREAGELASPMALICLGGMLSFQSIRLHWRKLLVTNLGRLVIVPAIGVTVFALLGYRDLELVTVLAVFGSPTAIASGPMAQAMGGNGKLAGEIVATTSASCILTIFLFVWLLKSMNLIM